MEFLDQEEDEIKPDYQTDPCLLCGEAAVTFDDIGNAIKRERAGPTGDLSQNDLFPYKQLFSCLCSVLEFPKNSRLRRVWDLEKEPFPLCENCEMVVRSVAHYYAKLDELRLRLKEIVQTAESKYEEDELYNDLDSRYATFRNFVLRGNSTLKVGRQCNRSKKHVDLSSPPKKSRDVDQPFGTQTKKSLSQAVVLPPRNYVVVHESSVDPEKEEFSEEDSPLMEDPLGDATITVKSESFTPEFELEATTTTSTSKYQLRGRQTNRRRKQSLDPSKPSSSYAEPSDDTSEEDEPNLRKQKQNKSRKSRIQSRRNKKGATRTQQWPLVASGIVNKTTPTTLWSRSSYKRLGTAGVGSMVYDPSSGNVTYRTGYGNMFNKTTSELVFEKVGKATAGSIPECYQCTLCSTRVPFVTITTLQIKEFRRHWAKFHSTWNRCQLCIGPPFLKSKELKLHLETEHKVESINKMFLIFYEKRNKGKLTHDLTWRKVRDKCEVCEMPFGTYQHQVYVDHVVTHMNDEERNLANEEVKAQFADILERPSSLSGEPKKRRWRTGKNGTVEEEFTSKQCQYCGEVLQSRVAFNHHMRKHDDNSGTGKQLCPVCGKCLLTLSQLDRHMNRFHPNGRAEPLPRCLFPDCNTTYDTQEDLQSHVQQVHGDSEVAKKGLMCKLCARGFTVPWCVKQHELVHTKDRNYKCHMCPVTFLHKSTLVAHLASKHDIGNANLKCEVDGCGRVYACKAQLRRHRRAVHKLLVGKPPPTN